MGMAAWPIIIPITPPTIDKITDSNRNWLKISDRLPPIALAIPISLVRSATVTNITFIIPIPDTSKVIAAIAVRRVDRVFRRFLSGPLPY